MLPRLSPFSSEATRNVASCVAGKHATLSGAMAPRHLSDSFSSRMKLRASRLQLRALLYLHFEVGLFIVIAIFRALCQQGRKDRFATHRSHEARTANADVSIRRPDGRCERSRVLRKRPCISPAQRGRSDALFPRGARCNGVVCCGFGAQTITGRGRIRNSFGFVQASVLQ